MKTLFITGVGLGMFLCAAAYADFTHFGGDTLELRASSEGHAAELHYVNDGGQSSSFGTVPLLTFEGVEVLPHIGMGVGQSERLTVTVLTPGYFAMPEVVDVPDGADVVVQIMFAGS